MYHGARPSHHSRGAPLERAGHPATMVFIRFRAPPAHPKMRRLSVYAETHKVYQVSRPSHPSMEARPGRAGHPNTIRCMRFRAPPTHPMRSRLSEQDIQCLGFG
eukprot:5821818-Pyramimonas_sp.AAC.1